MPVNDTTAQRAYQKPHPDAASQRDDVTRLRTALDAIDADVSALLAAIATKAPLASPALTGAVTVPDQAQADSSTLAANTGYVRTALDAVGSFAETAVASAATCAIGAANTAFISITGTATIASFGPGDTKLRFLRFAGALTLTHNATSLILPGGADIVTAADDTAIAISDGASHWRVVNYAKASGRLVAPKAGVGDVNWSPVSLASAATTDIAATLDTVVTVTGTVTITSFGTAASRLRIVVFAAALILTHNAASLILPTGANITTAAGDVAICVSDAAGNWKVVSYARASGAALAAAAAVAPSRAITAGGIATGGGDLSADRAITVPAASQPEAEAGADNTKAMTPLRTAQAIAALVSAGGIKGMRVITASGTYTKTAGVKSALVMLTGGGGGAETNPDGYWVAGGTGATGFKVVDLSAVSTVAVTIGAGGPRAASGGQSAFGSLMTANGGGGSSGYAEGTNSGTTTGADYAHPASPVPPILGYFGTGGFRTPAPSTAGVAGVCLILEF